MSARRIDVHHHYVAEGRAIETDNARRLFPRVAEPVIGPPASGA